ncbi:hypothetical protein N7504_007773 [Penicillium tannophilum]|nr:hypothetical protein N7504_007773 [Penicillium tannophilum]
MSLSRPTQGWDSPDPYINYGITGLSQRKSALCWLGIVYNLLITTWDPVLQGKECLCGILPPSLSLFGGLGPGFWQHLDAELGEKGATAYQNFRPVHVNAKLGAFQGIGTSG